MQWCWRNYCEQIALETEQESGGTADEGTLAYKVHMATRALIDKGVAGLHARTLDANHDPQHVPTAAAMHSHHASDEMAKMGGHAKSRRGCPEGREH